MAELRLVTTQILDDSLFLGCAPRGRWAVGLPVRWPTLTTATLSLVRQLSFKTPSFSDDFTPPKCQHYTSSSHTPFVRMCHLRVIRNAHRRFFIYYWGVQGGERSVDGRRADMRAEKLLNIEMEMFDGEMNTYRLSGYACVLILKSARMQDIDAQHHFHYAPLTHTFSTLAASLAEYCLLFTNTLPLLLGRFIANFHEFLLFSILRSDETREKAS